MGNSKNSMNGFLPINPPLKEYGSSSDSASLLRIQEVANNLPKLLLTDRVERTINLLSTDDFEVSELLDKNSEEEINLAMSQLSFIAHAYILGGSEPKSLLPKVIAKPWVRLSKVLARPPVLSYASYCLHNWYLLDSEEPIGLDNVALINNFLGGIDEDWFVTIHVCIENAASKAINASKEIANCTNESDEALVEDLLNKISISMAAVNEIFKRMPERCDPYVYYHRVRPFIFGSKDNPDLKNGVIYEGEYGNQSQFFRGETGAQSSIMPTLDGAMGIEHSEDSLRHYLNEMRDYMPLEHRKFIEQVESKSVVKEIIKESDELTDDYNKCLEEIRAFRALHLQYARTYIHNQSKQKNPFGAGGSTIRGTGGTPFMKYLKKHRDETQKQKQ